MERPGPLIRFWRNRESLLRLVGEVCPGCREKFFLPAISAPTATNQPKSSHPRQLYLPLSLLVTEDTTSLSPFSNPNLTTREIAPLLPLESSFQVIPLTSPLSTLKERIPPSPSRSAIYMCGSADKTPVQPIYLLSF